MDTKLANCYTNLWSSETLSSNTGSFSLLLPVPWKQYEEVKLGAKVQERKNMKPQFRPKLVSQNNRPLPFSKPAPPMAIPDECNGIGVMQTYLFSTFPGVAATLFLLEVGPFVSTLFGC